jgi:flagellar basal body-associated protein FliL
MKGKVWTIIVLVILLVGLVVFNGCKKSQPKQAEPAAQTKAVEPNQPGK